MKKRTRFLILILTFATCCASLVLFDYFYNPPRILNHNSFTLVEGETDELKIYDIRKSGKQKETPKRKYTLNSTNKDVVCIDENGNMTAKKNGKAEIHVVCKNETLICKIEVKKISFDKNNITIIETDSKANHLYLVDQNGDKEKLSKNIIWSSSDTEIASVSKSGTVTGRKSGDCQIFATYRGVKKEFSVVVKKLKFNIDKNITLYKGSESKIKVSKNIKKEPSYKSANSSIVKVDKNGNIKALKSGKTKVIVTLNNVQKECEVTVKDAYNPDGIPLPKPEANGFPKVYNDGTSKIVITKEWYKNAWVYAAHVQFSDYSRLKTAIASGGYETTSSADSRLGAILTVNGDYSADSSGGIVRNKDVIRDYGYSDSAGVYNQNTGIFEYGLALNGSLSSLVNSGRITDTMSFCHSSVYILDGVLQSNRWGHSRAQRTFVGTNGNPGDVWICVSDGRYNDGESAGLTYYECGEFLRTKGCTFGVPLDGGGSSTMVFNNQVLNAANGNERAVVDFVYFR